MNSLPLFFIILTGFLLRISFINKPEGLWNDEYVSWFIANTPFFHGFWNGVLKQCHMPLYYLYLKPFTCFSDTVLRFTSVIPGVVSIWIMYLVGKEFSKKNGYIAAAITSVLSFLIYYSQEVRFYSLLFMLSSLFLLYTVKYLKKSDKYNLIGYIISGTLLLLTHILAPIYIFFNILYVLYKKKKVSKYLLLCLIPAIPLGLYILNIIKMLPSSQWWGIFSYTNILFLVTDFFSPILTNNINAPAVFFYNKSLAAWMVLPSVIALAGILAGFRKGLFCVALAFVVTISFLAYSGNLVFITKYLTEILPIFILFMALGFTRLKKLGRALLGIFISIHLIAFFTPHYVTKIQRFEGHRIVGEILKHQNPDNIIFTYYEPDRFYRYVNLDGKDVFYISKINRFEYKDEPSKILKKIPVGESVSVVFLDSVSFFDEKFVEANINNPKIPEMFMTFSQIKNGLIAALNADFDNYEVDKLGAWTVVKATRKK